GSEGEAVADPRRQVAIEWLRDGAATTLVEAAPGDGALPELPPSRDAEPTARWIERALADESLLPPPLARQIATIAHICKTNNNARGTSIAREGGA
ncbi:MAG: DNA-binding protein YbiB, partial [Proteobacteria bacterium]|nr:DNA-binding protein YbiB [Pseudomonadota bacterium]